ncbi:MAG: hypothetical protein EBU46_12160 [Nitrosomonadaceae bacterium]|nr:hypothetical protein [Nitrosomonadaceae bacterium]
MLGWMQGPIYDAEPELTEDNNVPLEYLPYLSSLPNSLEEQLTYLVGEAKEDLDNARDSGADPDVIKQKEATLNQCIEWIDKAGIYLADIVDELAKGDESALRIDQEATGKSGVTHVTIKSLEKWASDVHNISTPDSFKSSPSAVMQFVNSQKNQKESATKLDNLRITFAILIEAFVKVKPRYMNANKINVSQLADFLSNLVPKADVDNSIKGQSAEAIKTRIEESIRKKREVS